jgi:hypothetical protein
MQASQNGAMQPRHDTPVSISAAEILGESSRTEARTALAGRLSDFDWQKVSQVLEWSDFLDRKHYRGLFRELSRLFMLKVEDGDYRGDQLSPSGACDVAWHALLMFPKDYAALCRTLGGEMLDHDPLISRSVHYVRTVALYRATFLDEPRACPPPARCMQVCDTCVSPQPLFPPSCPLLGVRCG